MGFKLGISVCFNYAIHPSGELWNGGGSGCNGEFKYQLPATGYGGELYTSWQTVTFSPSEFYLQYDSSAYVRYVYIQTSGLYADADNARIAWTGPSTCTYCVE